MSEALSEKEDTSISMCSQNYDRVITITHAIEKVTQSIKENC